MSVHAALSWLLLDFLNNTRLFLSAFVIVCPTSSPPPPVAVVTLYCSCSQVGLTARIISVSSHRETSFSHCEVILLFEGSDCGQLMDRKSHQRVLNCVRSQNNHFSSSTNSFVSVAQTKQKPSFFFSFFFLKIILIIQSSD